MFGIGLPEMILILALALIVVGPDKFPDLARSLAKGILELKKTAEGLKSSFAEEGNPLSDIRPELEDVTKSLKTNLLDTPVPDWQQDASLPGVNPIFRTEPTSTTNDVDAEYTVVKPPEAPDSPEAEPAETPKVLQAETGLADPQIDKSETGHGPK